MSFNLVDIQDKLSETELQYWGVSELIEKIMLQQKEIELLRKAIK
jgi:uncharacterized small protein (DUF1192 family)